MKSILITGANSGIGLATVKLFLENGYKVFAHYHISKNNLNKIVNDNLITYQVNFENLKEVEEMFDKITKQFGRIDVLVNNAGITKDGLAMRMKTEAFMDVINANLTSTFIGCREALKVMRKKRFGSVVNIASIVGETGNAGQTNYAASKGGTITMTKSFAIEAATSGIRYNTVTPGFIATEMTAVLKDEVKDAFTAKIPMARFGNPSEVAEAVAFLLSDHSSYITGETLKVNGGMNMA